jgi:WD40 repeat protein
MVPTVCLALLLSSPDWPLVPVVTLGKATMVCLDYGRIFATPDGKRAITVRGEWFDLKAGRGIDPPFAMPDGAVVHSLLDDGTVVIESAKQLHFFPPGTAKPKRTLDTLGRRTWLAPDGATAASVQGWTDDTVSLLATEMSKPGKDSEWTTIADKLPPVLRAVVNRSHAAVLFAGSRDVAVFDLTTKKRTDIPNEKPPPPTPGVISCYHIIERSDVALSPDGKVVYIARMGHVDVYASATGEELKDASFDRNWGREPVAQVDVLRQFEYRNTAWTGDGSKRVEVTAGGVLRVFDTGTGKQTDTHSTYPAFYGVKAIDDRRAIVWTADGRILTWELTTGKPVADVQLDLTGTLALYGGDVTMSGDGKELIASASPNSPRAVHADARTGRKLLDERELQPVFGFDGRVWIFDRLQQTLTKPAATAPLFKCDQDSSEGQNLHFDAAGRLAVVVSRKSVDVFETATGKPRCAIRLPDEHSTREHGGGLRTSGVYGRRLVVVREGDASIYDLPTQKLTGQIELNGNLWTVAAISADGRWLAVATAPKFGAVQTFTLYPLDHPNPVAAAVELPVRATTFTTGLAFTPDGKRLLTAHAGGTAHVWDISRFVAVNPREGELWAALGADDGEQVGKSMAEMVQTPRDTVAMLARRLTPAERIDESAVKARIGELASRDFRTREAATKALSALDEQAVPLLKAAMKADPVPEVVERLERVLGEIEARAPPAEWARQLRAVELLETIGTPDAERVLKSLANGAPGARLTLEAGRTLKRWTSDR